MNNNQNVNLKYLKYILIHIFVIGHTANAARIFDITINNYGSLNAAAVDALVLSLEDEVISNLPDADQGEFFQSMANASAMAGKDLTNDPINTIDYAMVFLGAGAGIDLNKKTFDDIKDSEGDIDVNNAPGVGVQLGFGLGVHGRFLPKKYFDGEKWSVFFNYLPYNYSKEDITLKIRTGGIHMRYRLWSGYDLIRWKMLRLEPVFVTFGYEFNKLEGRFSDDINEAESGSGGISGTFTGTGVINLDVTTHSFPLSISTGMTFLYLVTVYGGFGIDINQGKASGSGTIDNSSLVITDGSSNATGTATLDLGDDGKPKTFFSRAFLGAQINLWDLKIFAQAQKTFDRNLYGVQAGLKFVF